MVLKVQTIKRGMLTQIILFYEWMTESILDSRLISPNILSYKILSDVGPSNLVIKMSPNMPELSLNMSNCTLAIHFCFVYKDKYFVNYLLLLQSRRRQKKTGIIEGK